MGGVDGDGSDGGGGGGGGGDSGDPADGDGGGRGGGGDPLLPLPPWASPIFMFIFIPPRSSSNEMDRAGLHTVADFESVVLYLVLSLKIPFCHEGYFLVLFGAPP